MTYQSLLIVDDEPGVLNCLQRQLRDTNYTIHTATLGDAALEILKHHEVGVIISDQKMPKMDGVTFLERAKAEKPDAVRIMLTGSASFDTAVAAINRSQIFAYLTKPWSPDMLKGLITRAFVHYRLVKENRRLQRLTDTQNSRLKRVNGKLEELVEKRTYQLKEVIQEGVVMLAMAAETRDDDTGNHIHRIQALTREICTGLALPSDRVDDISFFSMMHDIGKIHIPDHVLKKKGRLTEDEFAVMKTHPVAGERILGQKPFYKTAREIARSHHERWDGAGYPDGLKGKEIPLSARIVAVADVFDALTHKRPYKEAWGREDALFEMKGLSEKAFDPEILAVFIETQSTHRSTR